MYELWISIASLILSIVAVSWNIKLQRESNDLQKRIVLIEEEREYERKVKSRQADLRAQLRKEESKYKLYIINLGQVEARNIRIKINGEPLEQHCTFVKGQFIPSYIGPGSKMSFLMAFSYDFHPPFEIELKWDDDYQKDRIRKDVLTF